MKKERLFICGLFVVFFCMACLKGNAQSGSGSGGNDFEVTGVVGAAKEKSNQDNYNSGYKPPDWFVQLWMAAKALAKILYGAGSLSNPSTQGIIKDYDEGLPFSTTSVQNHFGVDIGVGIGTKGGKFKYTDGTAKETFWYFEIPVLARYDQTMNDGGFFVALGPYYAIALGGQYKDRDIKQKLKFGSGSDADYRRGDWGIATRAGYKLKSHPISIGLTADIGLRNIDPAGNNDVRIKNQLLGLQVGYAFGFKK